MALGPSPITIRKIKPHRGLFWYTFGRLWCWYITMFAVEYQKIKRIGNALWQEIINLNFVAPKKRLWKDLYEALARKQQAANSKTWFYVPKHRKSPKQISCLRHYNIGNSHSWKKQMWTCTLLSLERTSKSRLQESRKCRITKGISTLNQDNTSNSVRDHFSDCSSTSASLQHKHANIVSKGKSSLVVEFKYSSLTTLGIVPSKE